MVRKARSKESKGATKNKKEKKKKKKSKAVTTHESSSGSTESSKSSKSIRFKKPSSGMPRGKRLAGLHKKEAEPRLIQLLGEERPDLVFGPSITQAEAELFNIHVKQLAELREGDLLYTENNYDEEDPKFTRFEITSLYNEGRYGAIYSAVRQIAKSKKAKVDPTPFCVKTALRVGSVRSGFLLEREIKMYKMLKDLKHKIAPSLIGNGVVLGASYIVLSACDQNLTKVMQEIGDFNPSTMAVIATQTLSALQQLHSLSYVHRDVKPTNFCIGLPPQNQRIFLVDFGECVKVRRKVRIGVPDQDTIPFWSISAHKKDQAIFRSDIESWFYMLLFLLRHPAMTWRDEKDDATILAHKVTLANAVDEVFHEPCAISSIAKLLFNSKEICGEQYNQLRQFGSAFAPPSRNPPPPQWMKLPVSFI